MTDFNVAPVCGYLTGPQNLGTVSDLENGSTICSPKPNVRSSIYTSNDGRTGFSTVTQYGTIIKMGETRCFASTESGGNIDKCVTQITGGTELYQDENGIRIQESLRQRTLGKLYENGHAPKLNAVQENEVFKF